MSQDVDLTVSNEAAALTHLRAAQRHIANAIRILDAKGARYATHLSIEHAQATIHEATKALRAADMLRAELTPGETK